MPVTPLCSVCIPVYNERERIADCINSVLAQTYENIEICISDNASSDGTFDVIKQYSEVRKNIRVQRQELNFGVAANFEAVMRMATGKYFMWLGADDLIMPEYIGRLVAELERHPNAVAAQSGIVRVKKSRNIRQEVRFNGVINPNTCTPLRQVLNFISFRKSVKNAKLNNYIYGVYKRDVLDRIMSSCSGIILAGDRVIPAMAALSGGVRYVDELLYIKYVHPKSFFRRRPDDPLRLQRENYGKPLNLIIWILTCPTIPLRRRWIAFIITAPFAVRKATVSLIGVLPQSKREVLKKFLMRVGWKPWETTSGKF